MPLSFPCPACSKRIRVSREHAGKTGRCPKCRQALQIPTAKQLADLALGVEVTESGEDTQPTESGEVFNSLVGQEAAEAWDPSAEEERIRLEKERLRLEWAKLEFEKAKFAREHESPAGQQGSQRRPLASRPSRRLAPQRKPNYSIPLAIGAASLIGIGILVVVSKDSTPRVPAPSELGTGQPEDTEVSEGGQQEQEEPTRSETQNAPLNSPGGASSASVQETVETPLPAAPTQTEEPTPEPASEVVKRAEAVAAKGRMAEALRICDEGLARLPGNPGLVGARGYFLLRLGRTEEGIEALRQAASAPEPPISAILNLSSAYLIQKQFDLALDRAEEAVRLDRSSASAAYQVSQVRYARKEYPLAQLAAERALELKPTDSVRASALLILGYALFAQRRFESAKASLEAHLEAVPREQYSRDQGFALAKLALARRELGLETLARRAAVDALPYLPQGDPLRSRVVHLLDNSTGPVAGEPGSEPSDETEKVIPRPEAPEPVVWPENPSSADLSRIFGEWKRAHPATKHFSDITDLLCQHATDLRSIEKLGRYLKNEDRREEAARILCFQLGLPKLTVEQLQERYDAALADFKAYQRQPARIGSGLIGTDLFRVRQHLELASGALRLKPGGVAELIGFHDDAQSGRFQIRAVVYVQDSAAGIEVAIGCKQGVWTTAGSDSVWRVEQRDAVAYELPVKAHSWNEIKVVVDPEPPPAVHARRVTIFVNGEPLLTRGNLNGLLSGWRVSTANHPLVLGAIDWKWL